MKQGELTWDVIVKLLLAVVFLLFISILIYLLRDKILQLVQKFTQFLRFGA